MPNAVMRSQAEESARRRATKWFQRNESPQSIKVAALTIRCSPCLAHPSYPHGPWGGARAASASGPSFASTGVSLPNTRLSPFGPGHFCSPPGSSEREALPPIDLDEAGRSSRTAAALGCPVTRSPTRRRVGPQPSGRRPTKCDPGMAFHAELFLGPSRISRLLPCSSDRLTEQGRRGQMTQPTGSICSLLPCPPLSLLACYSPSLSVLFVPPLPHDTSVDRAYRPFYYHWLYTPTHK